MNAKNQKHEAVTLVTSGKGTAGAQTMFAINVAKIKPRVGWNGRSEWRTDAAGTVDADGTYGDPDGGGGLGKDGLANDLEASGQISPVVVRPHSDVGFYELVAGYKRFASVLLLASQKRAVKGLDVGQIRVDVQALTDLQARSLNIRENTEREDLEPPDFAFSLLDLASLMAKEGKTVNSISLAKEVGKSQRYVADLYTIARDLDPATFTAWRASPFTLAYEKVLTISKQPKEAHAKLYGEALQAKQTATAGKADGRTDAAKFAKVAERAAELGKLLAAFVVAGLVDNVHMGEDGQVGEVLRSVMKLPTATKDGGEIPAKIRKGWATAMSDAYLAESAKLVKAAEDAAAADRAMAESKKKGKAEGAAS